MHSHGDFSICILTIIIQVYFEQGRNQEFACICTSRRVKRSHGFLESPSRNENLPAKTPCKHPTETTQQSTKETAQ